MVGRCISYWNGLFLGGHVNFQGCNHSQIMGWSSVQLSTHNPNRIRKTHLSTHKPNKWPLLWLIKDLSFWGSNSPPAEAGLTVGMSSLAAGMAIGVVGDAGVRANAQQPGMPKRNGCGGKVRWVWKNGVVQWWEGWWLFCVFCCLFFACVSF